jgi:two-component system phosphate regulon response regulator PhoB
MAKILLIEDTVSLAEAVIDWLENEQHVVECADTGAEAISRLRFYRYDLLIIDWGLPDMPGIEICRTLRKDGNTVPIIMLTAKRTIDDKETGLDSGADDYLTKPVEMRELSARIRALLRRPKQQCRPVLEVGNLHLDAGAHRITKDGQEVHLGPKEFAMLEVFMRHPGQVFTLEHFLETIWSDDEDASADSVRKSLSRLRLKINSKDKDGPLKTLVGVGYKLDE